MKTIKLLPLDLKEWAPNKWYLREMRNAGCGPECVQLAGQIIKGGNGYSAWVATRNDANLNYDTDKRHIGIYPTLTGARREITKAYTPRVTEVYTADDLA